MNTQDDFHYRDLLLAELRQRQTVNTGYSLRGFARDLGVDVGFLCHVLKGRKNLSLPKAHTVAKRLGYNTNQIRDFCQRVQIQNVPSHETRDLLHAISSLDKELTPAHIEEETLRVISDWVHVALLELVNCKNFRLDYKWIAERLGVTPKEAKNALHRLLKLRLIVQDGSGYRRVEPHLASTSNIPSKALRRYHAEAIDHAQRALVECPIDRRDITSITFATTIDRIPLLKEELRRFRRRILQLMQTDAGDGVFQLNLQLFEATRENQ